MADRILATPIPFLLPVLWVTISGTMICLYLSSIVRPVLTPELRGECGAGGGLGGGRGSPWRGAWRYEGEEGIPEYGVTIPCQECVTNFGKIIFIALFLYNFYYFVPLY